MRSLVKPIPTTIKVPTTVRYQFDDTLDPDRPHIFEWRGISASGESKSQALENLGIAINENWAVVVPWHS